MLLMCLRAHLHIIYDDDLRIFVRVLFIKYTIYPEKKKRFNAQKHDKKKAKANKKSGEPVIKHKDETDKKSSLLDKVLLIKEILSVAFKTFSRHLRVKISALNLRVASPDAAQTAIMYGAISAAVAGILELIDSYSNLNITRKTSVTVEPDFLTDKCEASINISLSISVFGALITLAKTFWKYFTIKNSKTTERN